MRWGGRSRRQASCGFEAGEIAFDVPGVADLKVLFPRLAQPRHLLREYGWGCSARVLEILLAMSKEVAFTMRAITASVPLAAAGEVLVTNSVVDLVEGAGIAFVDRGAHTLKGVPDPSQLWAVAGK